MRDVIGAWDILDVRDADGTAVRTFFERIPESDRTFLRDDVVDRSTLAQWASEPRNRRLVAAEGADVVGMVGIVRRIGWTSHVAELLVIVDPSHRRRGLGRALARRGLIDALGMGIEKLVVEVAADDEPSLAMFVALGFEAEAVLRRQIRDRAGTYHDMMVLAHMVDEASATMSTTGVEDALGAGSAE